jgi:acyl carrier protein
MKKHNSDIEIKLLNYIKNDCLSKNSKHVPGLEDDLFDAGIIDSAGLISFLAFIEIEYKIAIPDEDLLPENFKSISAITQYITSHQCHQEI